MPAGHVVLAFAKAPQAGRVKTRLAGDLGAEAALRIYDRMARRVWETLMRLKDETGTQIWLCYDPPEATEAVAVWLAGADRYLPQAAGDLGQRLEAGFREGIRARFQAIAAVGMDAPGLVRAQFELAFAQATNQAAVAGPTPDGGFYLLAVATPGPDPAALFQKVRWSSALTLADVGRNAALLGVGLVFLSPQLDIDTLADLQAYRRSPSQQEFPL